jgi:hypothetical protein
MRDLHNRQDDKIFEHSPAQGHQTGLSLSCHGYDAR